VPEAARRNRTVNVAGAEYWWLETDLSDSGLVLKLATTPGGGGSATYTDFSFDTAQDGAATYALPAGTTSVQDVRVQQAGPEPRPTRPLLNYRLSGTTLLISEKANLLTGDTVVGTAVLGGGGGTPGTPARDNNNVPQSVRDAVSDASNLWSYGDLVDYGTADLETAALAGMVKGDYFDAFEQGSATDAYRYCYCQQNAGNLGWTRLLKYS
jgi:hypothetical protein